MKALFIGLFLTSTMTLAAPASKARGYCHQYNDFSNIASQFQFQNNGQDDATLKPQSPYLCQLSGTTLKTFEALSFIQKYSFLPTLNHQIDQNLIGADAWKFLKQRIKKISFDKNEQGACNSLTFAYVGFIDDTTMHICPIFQKQYIIDQAETLIHEARHNEGYAHSICEHGPYKAKDEYSCDESYKDQGSYAVGVEFKIRLSEHNQLDPYIRAQARGSALKDLFERFNINDFGTSQNTLLQTTDGKILRFDGKSITFVLKSNPTDILSNLGGEATIIDPFAGTAKYIIPGSSITVDSQHPLAIEFKDTPEVRRSTLRDAFSTNEKYEYGCLMFPKLLKCVDNESGEILELDLSATSIRPRRFLYINTNNLLKEKIRYLLDEDGTLYSLPSFFKYFKKTGISSITKESSTFSFVHLARGPSEKKEVLLINNEGQLFINIADNKKTAPQTLAIALAQNLKLKTLFWPWYTSSSIPTLY